MEDWIKDLRYILMPTRKAMKGYEKEYHEAYAIWQAAWGKFRRDINIPNKLNSDGLMVTDEMGVLYYQGKCVGLSAFTHGDLERGPMPDLSWFNAWTPEAYDSLKAISNNAIICSQFTVNPEFTGKGHVVRWKEIVTTYTYLRFEHSNAGVMAGHLNVLRGMQNASGGTYGATVLHPGHTFDFFGVPLVGQLVAYERENMKLLWEEKKMVTMVEDLWSRLEHISDFDVVAPAKVLPFKKAA